MDMTLKGNDEIGNQNILDGSPPCPGQDEEGKFYADLQRHLEKKYPEFLPYLTLNDLCIYDDGLTYYNHESRRDRAMKGLAWSTMMDKLPEGVLHEYQTRVGDEFKIRMMQLRKQKQQHAGYELGAREFTLTYSPKWFSDEEARRQMSKAIQKLIQYYKNGDQKIINFRAIGEVGSNGLSHVHCFYQLLGGVKITDKNFKRAYPPWDTKTITGPSGHKGGHHATVRHHSDFLGYIEKEVSSAWLDVSYPTADPN